jgi:multiple sugar transport system ATP-binding protein
MAEVTYKDVDKVFEGGVHAVKDLSLEIGDGEFLVLVGPSGCGKTTALRMAAGLEDISAGTVTIGGRVVNDLDPKERDVAMVFQNYALYPHLNVYENIAFGLRLRRTPKEELSKRVEWAAKLLDLSTYLGRRPKELSGGQRQRVAMGRAIVRQPQAFLMDEPLSNLDAKLRVQMRAEISQLQHELGVTTIYVTHDQVEAMTMGDRVALMRRGELQQVDAPQRLYREPGNLFVASFIGSPPMNLVEATLEAQNGSLVARFGDQELALPEETLSERPALRGYTGRTVALGIRPEQMQDAALARDVPEERRLRGRVVLAEALGAEVLAHVEMQGKQVVREEVLEGTVEDLDDPVAAATGDARRMTFIGRFDGSSEVQPNDVVEVAIDTRRLHFFDLESTAAIGAAS